VEARFREEGRVERSYNKLGLMVITHASTYLRESLESVLAQTVKPSDVIVVDNASPADASASEVAERFGFATVRIERPVSPATARNIGCEALEDCDLVINLDGDDVLLPTFVEVYWRTARETAADIVFGAAELFGVQTGIEFTEELRGPTADIRRGNYIPANSLFRRETWRMAGGFDPTIGLYDDYDFWLSCLERGASLAFVAEPLWRYRRHDSSRLSTVPLAEKRRSRELIRTKHRRYINGALQWRRVVRQLERFWVSRSRREGQAGAGP